MIEEEVLIILVVLIEIGGAWFFEGLFIVGDVLVVVAVDTVFSVLITKDVPS